MLTDDKVDLSLVLSELLDRAGWAQRDLAYVLDIQDGTVWRWVHGTGKVPSTVLADIAFVLGISVEALLDAQRAREQALERSLRAQEMERQQRERQQAWLAVWRGREDEWQRQQALSRLLAVGMVRLAEARPPTYELYCLACGRGIGPGGVLRTVARVPHWHPPCAFCGGHMLAREFLTGSLERDFYQRSHSAADERNAA